MKTFVKENWYKLMIGSSMFIFSVSALIYSISPARAENVFKAKSNTSQDYDFYLVDSQDQIWQSASAGYGAIYWRKTGKTLK